MDAMTTPLTENQRRQLCDLIHTAFLEIRILGWRGCAQQAADLADAFHELPNGMWRDDFETQRFRDIYLLSYEQKYQENERMTSYVKMMDQVMATR
jgi:hypothetical protein